MGELSAGPEAIDDFILIKSDGFPTYNFCHIIDDMQHNADAYLIKAEITPKKLLAVVERLTMVS